MHVKLEPSDAFFVVDGCQGYAYELPVACVLFKYYYPDPRCCRRGRYNSEAIM
jgi:hypothetical protein